MTSTHGMRSLPVSGAHYVGKGAAQLRRASQTVADFIEERAAASLARSGRRDVSHDGARSIHVWKQRSPHSAAQIEMLLELS
jgi:hypothetical protein